MVTDYNSEYSITEDIESMEKLLWCSPQHCRISSTFPLQHYPPQKSLPTFKSTSLSLSQHFLIFVKIQGIQLLLRVVTCTIVAVHAVDWPRIEILFLNSALQCQHLAPGLLGLLLLSGLEGRVETGLGGSDIGLGVESS